jgi:hypothetical protein
MGIYAENNDELEGLDDWGPGLDVGISAIWQGSLGN